MKTPQDLALALDDDDINVERAAYLLSEATGMVADFANLLIATSAKGQRIVERVAARAYVKPTNATGESVAGSSVSYADSRGGLFLDKQDKVDLRRAMNRGPWTTVQTTRE